MHNDLNILKKIENILGRTLNIINNIDINKVDIVYEDECVCFDDNKIILLYIHGNFDLEIWESIVLLKKLSALFLSDNLSIPFNFLTKIKILTRLELINCNIHKFPREIILLDSLISLDLSGNSLTELPPEIVQLSRLVSLSLWGNKLAKLPPEITQLRGLTTLNLSQNGLTVLPLEIAQLTGLTSLDLSENRLTELPPEIGRLTGLTSLELSGNALAELPSEITQLTRLTSLSLWGNKLATFPPEITQLRKLTTLNLSQNGLTALPPEIAKLTGLISLGLWGNKLTVLPSEITQLRKLTSLSLGGNGFTELPLEIVQLTGLTILNLSRNRLTALPSEIIQLTGLTSLELSGNGLTTLPSAITQLKGLTSLGLGGNKLTSLPSEIAQLAGLTSLNLSQNGLTSLPSEIAQLVGLTSLNLSQNGLTVLPLEIARLTGLTSLDLSRNGLTVLPLEITQLTGLISLDLSRNGLTTLPSEITQLRSLTSLDLSRNRLMTLPPEITQLRDLTSLDLSRNGLTTLPPEIVQLTGLVSLELSENELTVLPSEIAQLTGLTSLSLGGNKLTELPSEIAQLTGLASLDLSRNGLTTLPPEIPQMKGLSSLELSENRLTVLPPDIAQLTGLISLNISNNLIIDLPNEITTLAYLKMINVVNNKIRVLPEQLAKHKVILDGVNNNFWYQDGIYIANNPLQSPPLELIQKGEECLTSYYSALKEGAEKLNEVKVIFVGEGGSGKTSLIKRLTRSDYNPKEPQTHGVRIKEWLVGNDTKIHFWDFGGQDIMHSTHQFFLSKRSIYVLVLDGRKDEKAEYWLKMIRSFGGDAPIFVILNKMDQNPSFQVNEKNLSEKYPTIQDYYRLSCDTNGGVNSFETDLYDFIALGHENLMLETPVPISWMKLKEEFESSEKNHQRNEDFSQMCDRFGIPKNHRETVLTFLHELGTMLHFSGENILEEYFVLNPRWVTDAAYKIINSKRVSDKNGILENKDVQKVLNEDTFCEKEYDEMLGEFSYSPAESEFIISLLKQFKLGFPLSETSILIPDLLTVQEPIFSEPSAKSIAIVYEYDFLPPSIMPQFIVAMHQDRKDGLVWRSGVILENLTFNSWALVKSDTEAKKLFIKVIGYDAKEYLAVIRETIARIHASFEKIGVQLKLIIDDECNPDPVPYEHLKQLEKIGDEYYRPFGKNGTCNQYNVKELLGEVQSRQEVEDSIFKQVIEKLSVIERRLEIDDIEKEILILQPNIAGIGIDLLAIKDKIKKHLIKTNTYFSLG